MNIENLRSKKEIKNYKEMCVLIEEKEKTGNSRKAQIKEWERFVKFHKEGQKYIIDELYDIPLSKEDGRLGGNNSTLRHKLKNKFNVSWEDRNRKGVYIIKNKKSDVYIGSTVVGFRTRFMQHYNNYDGNMQHTYDLLHNGGVFEIIYDTTDVIDEELVRMVEDEYIKLFMMNKNFNVINVMKTNNKEKFKTIRFKVKEDEYIKILQMLAKEGLVDLEGCNFSEKNY